MCVVYEGMLLFGLAWFAAYVFSSLAQFRGEPGTGRLVFQLYMAAVLGAYFAWLWSGGRRTLPMKTLAVQLVTDAGAPLTPARAAWRYVLALALTSLPLAGAQFVHPAWFVGALLPFGWMLADPLRRTLWDRMAGTRMVVDAR